MNRRTLVRLLGAGAAVGLAGCGSEEGGAEGPAASPNDSPDDSPEETGMTDTGSTAPDQESTATDGGTDAEGIVTVTSEDSVEETVSRIQGDIEGSDLTLMTTVDHASNAESAGEDLPPTTLLVFGNPTVGTPLMQAKRSVAIDLPQKMLVWDDDGQTRVSYNDPQYLADRHGIEGQDDRIEQIGTVLEGLAKGDDEGE